LDLCLGFARTFVLFWPLAVCSVSERLLAISGFDPILTANRVALEFLTGYVIEQALSVDNLFVFVVIFQFFAIPDHLRHRVLFFGILGALFFRAIFISLGSLLVQFHWVMILFGVFLLLTGLKIIFSDDKVIDPDKNKMLRFLNRYLPVTSGLHGNQFFVRVKEKLMVTPLLICLLFIEISDVVFAVDSVPAIFAITKEPLIVFTSNIFAVMGLRSMYFLLAGVVDQFYLLKYALGLVLIFIGLKMVYLNDLFEGHFPILWSLGIICALIFGSVLLSLAIPKRNQE
jgi:tellurite resistance protein TerC